MSEVNQGGNVEHTKKAGRRRRSSLKGGMLVGLAPPMGGRRRRSRGRKMAGGMYYGMTDGPLIDGMQAAGSLGPTDTPQPILGGVQTAGRRRRTRRASKGKKPMSPWLQHVMAIKNKKGNEAMSLGDAMKEAKKTYKK